MFRCVLLEGVGWVTPLCAELSTAERCQDIKESGVEVSEGFYWTRQFATKAGEKVLGWHSDGPRKGKLGSCADRLLWPLSFSRSG